MPASTPAYTQEDLVARLQELATRLGRRDLSLREFHAATGISPHHVVRAAGTYGALRAAAGLEPPPNVRLDNDTLLRALRDACLKAGGVPRRSHAERFGAHSKPSYAQRWGDWRGTLRALRAWVEANDPAFPYIAALPPNDPRPAPQRPRRIPGAAFGAPLHFGPLMHEPTNEQGVLLLFGLLATPLGFAIERVGPSFPDCEAKQRVTGGWRRVRIEFEYQSRNFEKHGHDAQGCDLIVCWEHNWPDAPLEVLELKREVHGTRPRASQSFSAPVGRLEGARHRATWPDAPPDVPALTTPVADRMPAAGQTG